MSFGGARKWENNLLHCQTNGDVSEHCSTPKFMKWEIICPSYTLLELATPNKIMDSNVLHFEYLEHKVLTLISLRECTFRLDGVCSIYEKTSNQMHFLLCLDSIKFHKTAFGKIKVQHLLPINLSKCWVKTKFCFEKDFYFH